LRTRKTPFNFDFMTQKELADKLASYQSTDELASILISLISPAAPVPPVPPVPPAETIAAP
jgi:hypothetical protein